MKIKAPFRELSERVSTALNRERIKEVNLFEGFLVFEKCGQVNYNTAERFDRTVGDVKGYYEDGCEAESLNDPKINKYKLELEDEDVVDAEIEDAGDDDLEIKDPEDLDDLDDDCDDEDCDDDCDDDCDPEDSEADDEDLDDEDLDDEDEVKESKNDIKAKLDKIVKDFANVRESSVIRKLREAARARRVRESSGCRARKIEESDKYASLRAKYKSLRKQH